MTLPIIKKWTRFCQTPSSAQIDDFYTLFTEPLNEEDLNEIFACVKGGEILKARMARLKKIAGVPQTIESPERKQAMEKVALDLLSENIKLLNMLGYNELENILSKLHPNWVSLDEINEQDATEKAWVKGEVKVVIGDYFRNLIDKRDMVLSALMEATYGLTADYDMIWYLLLPIMDTDYNAEPSILLRENQVIYSLTESNILLCDMQ